MKRQIMKGLAALCAGVMTLCATSFFSSCDRLDVLDEQVKELEGNVEDLQGQIDKLKERVEAIEALKQQLEALGQRVAALEAVELAFMENPTTHKLMYSLNGGTDWTTTDIVLAQVPELEFRVTAENKLQVKYGDAAWTDITTLAKDCEKNVTLRVNSETNELEIAMDGVNYTGTGIILAKDCDNDFKFQVNAETNEVEFSFDGGKTWIPTGDKCVDPCAKPEVKFEETDEAITVWVGKESFVIAKPQQIEFEIKAGKMFFATDDTKTVVIKTSGIDDVTIIAVPKGWEAELDSDGNVVITAPSEDELPLYDYWGDLIQAGTAVAEGYVKVHACSADGKCMVGKISVATSDDPISLQAYAGKFHVGSYNTVYYGVSPVATYEKDAQELMDLFNGGMETIEDLMEWPNQVMPEGEVVSVDIAEALGTDLVAGEEYVIWALQETSVGLNVTHDDLVLAFYTHVGVEVTEGEKSAFEFNLTVDVKGADSYILLAEPIFDEEEVEYKKEMILYMFETLLHPTGGMMGMGVTQNAVYNEKYTGSVCNIDGLEGSKFFDGLKPEQQFTVFVLPVDGRPTAAYTAADIIAETYSTNALKAGSSITATVEPITSVSNGTFTKELDKFTELGVKVAASSNDWAYCYFAWVDEDTAALSDEELVAYVTANNQPVAKSTFKGEATVSGLKDNQTLYFVSFFVDAEDQYGQVYAEPYTTKALAFNEISLGATPNLDATLTVLKNTQTLEVTLNPASEITKYKYISLGTSNSNYTSNYADLTPDAVAKNLYYEEVLSYYGVYEKDYVAGETNVIEVPNLKYGTSYFFALIAYDADGNPSKSAVVYKYDCKFELTGVKTSDFVDEPVVAFPEHIYNESGEYDQPYYKWDDTEYKINAIYEVTPTNNATVYSLICNPALVNKDGATFEGLTVDQKAAGLVTGILPSYSENSNIKTTSGTAKKSYYRAFYFAEEETPAPVLMYCWKSGDTYYYKEVNLADKFAAYKADIDAKKTVE